VLIVAGRSETEAVIPLYHCEVGKFKSAGVCLEKVPLDSLKVSIAAHYCLRIRFV